MPLLVYFLFFKIKRSVWVKALFFYSIVSFLNDGILLVIEHSKYNHYTYRILISFTIIEYSFFSYFLYGIIETKLFKRIIFWSAVVFVLFSTVYLFTSKDTGFDSISASIEAITIVAFCILYLFDQLNKPQVVFIYQDPNFWFVAGFMVYLSGALFMFIQASELIKATRDHFWNITLFASITKNILFSIGFSMKESQGLFLDFDNPFEDQVLENTHKT